ncbi:MAG: N-acetyltransferase family protein [Micromonosporaceae bacterium]
MSVRRLGIADLQVATGIAARLTRSRRLDPWDFLADPYTLLMVAEEDGHVVGWLCGYELVRPDGSRMMLIHQIEVDKPARRRGHGRALVDAALAVAIARGHSEVVVTAGPGDPSARALFAGAGARQAQLRQLYRWSLGDGDSKPSSR